MMLARSGRHEIISMNKFLLSTKTIHYTARSYSSRYPSNKVCGVVKFSDNLKQYILADMDAYGVQYVHPLGMGCMGATT